MHLVIKHQHIVDNIKYLQNEYAKKMILVVKNNAYNTGLISCVSTCLANGITHFATTSLEEAITIRKLSKSCFILLLNPINSDEILLAKTHNITLMIPSLLWYQTNESFLEGISLHLKINVGMNRFGLDSIDEINHLLKLNQNITGIFTHFPVSDLSDLTIHHQQVNNFVKIYQMIENKTQLNMIHAENSATTVLKDQRLAFCDFLRIGIMAYGGSIDSKITSLKNTIYLSTKIIHIIDIKEDGYIGYGLDKPIKKGMRIGLCPIGYGDGLATYRKELPVIINDKPYSITSLSMSHLLIEIDNTINIMDDVEIYGDTLKLEQLFFKTKIASSVQMASLQHHIK